MLFIILVAIFAIWLWSRSHPRPTWLSRLITHDNPRGAIERGGMKLAYTIIYVADVGTTLRFYEKAFGGRIGFVHENGHYGELETGTTTLAFASESCARTNMGEFRRNEPHVVPAGFEVAFATPDVDAAYAHALIAGAVAVKAPEQKHWGQRIAYVRDINGVIVELCALIEQKS